jgi:Photosynthetic reaction centre cytochrome C subunit
VIELKSAPLLVLLFLASNCIPSFGQQATGGGAQRPAAKNLKVLAATTEIPFVMQNFSKALGVQCTYCHVQGDFPSDANPKKDIARKMIAMVRQIDLSFPSTAGIFPDGYSEVDCITCHRGSVKPETKAPHEFVNHGELTGTIVPGNAPGVNLKVLPPDTKVHGASIMHDFRDALNVDCGFCHGAGKPYEVDVNPRKEIARGMISLVRKINTNFPGTGVFPVGPQAVTCYTCHREETHPLTVANASYGPPAEKK